MSRWAMAQRMMFIGTTLLRDYLIRRRDLVERFGISLQQASHDLAVFRELNPTAMVYDASAKAFILAAQHRAPPPIVWGPELAALARPCRELSNICDVGGECLKCDAIQGEACKRPMASHWPVKKPSAA